MLTAGELGMQCAAEKLAYGGADTGYEYDRWLDGGPAFDDRPLSASRQRIIDMTKTLADAAKARGASVKFYGDRYDDPSNMYSADEAVKRLMAAKQIDPANEDTLPNYYHMDYPRKPRAGLAELLRLKTPAHMERDEAFPAGTHPLSVVNEKYFKKAKVEKQSGELDMLTVAELGRLSAQTRHTKQASWWTEALRSLYGNGQNSAFGLQQRQPQQGMGGPVVMPGMGGPPVMPGMGGPVVMPGMGARHPVPMPAPKPMGGTGMLPAGLRPVPMPRFGAAPFPGANPPAPPPGGRYSGTGTRPLPFYQNNVPKGPAFKNLPAPVPTDAPPKGPGIQRL